MLVTPLIDMRSTFQPGSPLATTGQGPLGPVLDDLPGHRVLVRRAARVQMNDPDVQPADVVQEAGAVRMETMPAAAVHSAA